MNNLYFGTAIVFKKNFHAIEQWYKVTVCMASLLQMLPIQSHLVPSPTKPDSKILVSFVYLRIFSTHRNTELTQVELLHNHSRIHYGCSTIHSITSISGWHEGEYSCRSRFSNGTVVESPKKQLNILGIYCSHYLYNVYMYNYLHITYTRTLNLGFN